jgi:O-methyltransferase
MKDKKSRELSHIQALLKSYPLLSDQIKPPALQVVIDALEQVLEVGVEGDIAEFGCYIGTTSLFIRRLLDIYGQSDRRLFYAYDSFEGLPSKSWHDTSAAGVDFRAGELAISKKRFLREFHKAHLKPPITHKAWFGDIAPERLPDTIAFAFLDGDFYESICDSLALA